MAFVLQNAQFYCQQIVLWVDFFQQTHRSDEGETHFLRQVWESTRGALADYLQLSDPALVDFIVVFIDGLILQHIYSRVYEQGSKDAAWLHQQSQLMIQMILHHEQNFSQSQT